MFVDVLGVGVDMVEVARFRELSRGSDLVHQFLLSEEIEDIFCRKEPAQALAGRFAAKEAIIKAARSALPGSSIFFKDIRIEHDASGAPRAFVNGRDSGNFHILLSVSHTREYAIAFAMIARRDDVHEQ